MQSIEQQIVDYIEEHIVSMSEDEISKFKLFLEENFILSRKDRRNRIEKFKCKSWSSK